MTDGVRLMAVAERRPPPGTLPRQPASRLHINPDHIVMVRYFKEQDYCKVTMVTGDVVMVDGEMVEVG